jgi:hypothetical protein
MSVRDPGDDYVAAVVTAMTARTSSQAADVLRELDSFCRAVGEATDGAVRCWRERGRLTSYGQEWRILIAPKESGYEYPLFRAHVPEVGATRLDLYDDEMVRCHDVSEIRAALTDFVGRADTIDSLHAMGQPA